MLFCPVSLPHTSIPQIGVSFFAWKYSNQAIAKDAWMDAAVKTPAVNPFNDDRTGHDQYEDGDCPFWDCDEFCDPDEQPQYMGGSEKCIWPPDWATRFSPSGMSLCWGTFRNNRFCGYGWLRLLNILSTVNYFSWWITAFAALSWRIDAPWPWDAKSYVHGGRGGGGGAEEMVVTHANPMVWTKAVDAATGREYYINSRTRAVSWTKPVGFETQVSME